MKRVSEETQARTIIRKFRDLIEFNMFNPMTLDEAKFRRASYDCAIEFANSIIDHLKWYQFDSKLYWREVRLIIMNEKISYIEYEFNTLKQQHGTSV